VGRVIDERNEQMQVTITRRMAVTGVAVVALVGAGGAIAASGHSNKSGTASKRGTCGPGGRGPLASSINAVANYLGLTNAELRTARQNGTSLAQLATQQGKSVSGLKQAIYDAAKADFDKAVSAGRITAAQEATRLSDLQSHLDDIVNSTGPPPLGPPPAA
jgi:hypothetical protein